MITIEPEWYVHGFWYCTMPGMALEYLSIAYKESMDEEDQHFYGIFRIANSLTGEIEMYKVDGEEKSEEEIKAVFDEQVASIRAEVGGGDLYYLECKTDGISAFEKLGQQPWVRPRDIELISQPEPDLGKLLDIAKDSTDKFGD